MHQGAPGLYAGDCGDLKFHMGTHVHADQVYLSSTAIALVPLHAGGGCWVEAHFVLREPLPRPSKARQQALQNITRSSDAVTPWFMLAPCGCHEGHSVWTCPHHGCTDKQYTPGTEQQCTSARTEGLLRAAWHSFQRAMGDDGGARNGAADPGGVCAPMAAMGRGQAACVLARRNRDQASVGAPKSISAAHVRRLVCDDNEHGYVVQNLEDLPDKIRRLVNKVRTSFAVWNQKFAATSNLEDAVASSAFLTRDRALPAQAAQAMAADLWPAADCGSLPVIDEHGRAGAKRRKQAVPWEPMVRFE